LKPHLPECTSASRPRPRPDTITVKHPRLMWSAARDASRGRNAPRFGFHIARGGPHSIATGRARRRRTLHQRHYSAPSRLRHRQQTRYLRRRSPIIEIRSGERVTAGAGVVFTRTGRTAGSSAYTGRDTRGDMARFNLGTTLKGGAPVDLTAIGHKQYLAVVCRPAAGHWHSDQVRQSDG